jgi:hypothetical protein
VAAWQSLGTDAIITLPPTPVTNNGCPSSNREGVPKKECIDERKWGAFIRKPKKRGINKEIL